ncbi:putative ABC exporter domain-containing protein [Myxococcus stipitatus]|uniref:putative ABC exporter domain-containing protein n=1 Tax=Myxococcus stipitatus TaxID=83455 RepID=UPI001F2DB5C4|nr:putative ABC exporter domain-containing protein [Myxococcus stipitatus]MCE9672942.1 putative ABC exporter domain-containing protein [Myxococcus stipitatus]
MSFPGAVGFLWLASWRNRLRLQLQRLRRPRYLLGALVGLGYVYSVFLRRLDFSGPLGSVPPGVRLFAELSLVVSALATVLGAWALGPDRPSLTFSDAEVVQLFPAPVERTSLLHYKLARGWMGAALGALMATLFIGRLANPSPALFFAGSLLGLGTLYLHTTAASFTRTRLAARGWVGQGLRWGGVGLALMTVGWVGFLALEAHPFPEDVGSGRQVGRWLESLLATPGVSALLWPARLLVAPSLARDLASFVHTLPPVGVMVVAHYVWLRVAEVPFEEAAVLRAESRTRERALRGSGRGGKAGAIPLRKAPFRLAARGRPEVALVWKNLIARKRLGGGALSLVVFLLTGGVVAALMGDARLFTDTRRVLGPLALTAAVLLTVMGPSAFRMDLRMDMPKLDLLRALPLAGWQVVGAELAASALAVGAFQVGLLGVALGMGPGVEDEGLRAAWGPGLLSLGFVLPAVSLAGLFVQNAAVVLFPAWVPADRGERARGIEALGQRLLTLMGSLVVTLVGLAPASLVGLVVGFPLWPSLEVWSLPWAAAAAALVLVAEVGVGIALVGRAFEHLDVAEDRPE